MIQLYHPVLREWRSVVRCIWFATVLASELNYHRLKMWTYSFQTDVPDVVCLSFFARFQHSVGRLR